MKFGATCGTMANQTRSTQLAPTARSPSSAFMSTFSTASKNSLPSAPTVWIETAMTAGSGPIDRIARKKPASTTSGKARSTSMKRRTEPRTIRFATRFLAARKESRKPKTMPMMVEKNAIFSVSSILWKYSGT